MSQYALNRYRLGNGSRGRLETCHPLLVAVVERAIIYTPMDFSVVCGWRGEADQNAAADGGASSTRWPDSRHNHLSDEDDVAEGYADRTGRPLSLAVDLAPWIGGRLRWDLPWEIRWLNGFVNGIGQPIVSAHGFYLRSGNDWDMDGDQEEHKLKDSPHTELRRLG